MKKEDKELYTLKVTFKKDVPHKEKTFEYKTGKSYPGFGYENKIFVRQPDSPENENWHTTFSKDFIGELFDIEEINEKEATSLILEQDKSKDHKGGDMDTLAKIKELLDDLFPDDKEPDEEDLDFDSAAVDMYHALYTARSELEAYGF